VPISTEQVPVQEKMEQLEENLQKDINLVKQIPIIHTLLEVVCHTTGMRFAAVARVTEDRWIACEVRDEINFGLSSGGELPIKTTICDEIREQGRAVIIDHVDKDPLFCNHHTPKMYGLQSYISIPIYRMSGEFFGTLCAIDPKPAELNNAKTIGMFNLFAELIAFHLQALEEMETSKLALQHSNRKLQISRDENRQYQHISNHTLQEPLRKIQLFSDQLANPESLPPQHTAQQIASKINRLAKDLSLMIKNLTDFSELDYDPHSAEMVDLNTIIAIVFSKLQSQILAADILVQQHPLPVVNALPNQMTILFYHLLHNAIRFAQPDITPVIKVYAKEIVPGQIENSFNLDPNLSYCEICVEDNGIGIDKVQLEVIFNVFTRTRTNDKNKEAGIGLAQCKKIVTNHGGTITAHSEPGKGTTFSVILPIAGK
jgi:signal transduction histidine kinase